MWLTDTDESLVRFLLGDLPPREHDAIERQTFEDDGRLLDTLTALEDELRFAYLGGYLSGRARASFESRYLDDAEGRARLACARALVLLADRPRRQRPP